MDDKTNNHSVADGCVAPGDMPSQAAPQSRPPSSCLAGCGCLLVIMILAAVLLGVWIWQLNRNPDPFPWTPERQWTMPARPVALDFVDRDGSLIVLCDEGKLRARVATSITRCDFETGTILSSHPLPFPVSAFSASPATDSVLVAGIVPSPDEAYILIGLPDGTVPRPHLLRLATLRLADWSVDAEYEDELEASSLSTRRAESLRVEAVPAQKAWAVGIADPKTDTYRVSLYHQETLAEMDSRTLPSGIEPREACLTVDSENPSTILIGRPFESFTCRWDLWATDSGNVTTLELRGDLFESIGAMPGDVHLTDCYVQGLAFESRNAVAGISPKGRFHARAFNSQVRSVLPQPRHPDNVYRTGLAIRRWTPSKPIVSGLFQGRAHAIMTLRFSPNNEFLVTGHHGGDIRLWGLPSGGQ